MAEGENGNGAGKMLEKLVLWIGRLSGIGALLWFGSAKFTGLEEQGRAVLAELAKRPTSEGVENQVLRAVQPLTQGMAEVRVELRSLAERVQRLEQSNK